MGLRRVGRVQEQDVPPSPPVFLPLSRPPAVLHQPNTISIVGYRSPVFSDREALISFL